MRVSTDRLLSEVIDYAGIFPPARLELEDALDRYLAYRTGRERWIVGRFVCATTRLADLADALGKRKVGEPVQVVAIGRPSTNRFQWEDALEQDAKGMNEFVQAVGDHAELAVYEVRVPSNEGIEESLRDLRGFRDVDVFVELPWGEGQEDALARLAETEWLGAKARTGGLEASAFPDAYAVAGFIRNCVDLELPFKLTAGLHHPLPSKDEATGAAMHGFLNVLSATTLGLTEDLSRREMERLLLDSDPKSWHFDDRSMSWRGHEAALDDIEEARSLFVSFGSCSIDEPIQDLKSLGF